MYREGVQGREGKAYILDLNIKRMLSGEIHVSLGKGPPEPIPYDDGWAPEPGWICVGDASAPRNGDTYRNNHQITESSEAFIVQSDVKRHYLFRY
jgi:hypothetical protein